MEVLKLIQENPRWEQILAAAPYYVTAKWDGDYVLLKYNQLASDFTNPIVRECRGCIFYLPHKNHKLASVVCFPFTKFGNYGESYVPEIDWATAKVQEKVDGSLIKMWYHNDRWHISTNGTIDAAEAPTNFENVNFHDIVMRAIEAKGDPIGFFDTLNPRYTYMFELVSPETRVTIAYPETKLYFLGCRDMVTFEEKGVFSQTLSFVSRVAQPKRYPLSSLEDCLNAVAAMKADEEGFVICDAHYNRIKIKSPEYLIASRIRNNGAITTRTILELIREDKLDDFLAYAEDYQGFVDEVIKGYNNLIAAYNDAIQLVFFSDEYDIVDKRDLALQTTHLPAHIRAILFAHYDHKISNVYDWIAALPVSTLTELVKQYKVAA